MMVYYCVVIYYGVKCGGNLFVDLIVKYRCFMMVKIIF